jgi:hypothetical protein
MTDPGINKTSIGRRLWTMIANGWVANVPEDIALCEFDCRNPLCTQQQWEICGYRLQQMAVVESYDETAATVIGR